MWGGQGPSGGPWVPFGLQQSSYKDMPHEQVDWAALAKQWISQREDGKPPGPPPSFPPPAKHNRQAAGDQHKEPSFDHGQIPQGNWGWGMPGMQQQMQQNWNRDVPNPSNAPHMEGDKVHPFVDYGHGNPEKPNKTDAFDYAHGNPDRAKEAHTFDYGHGNQAPEYSQSFDYSHGGSHQFYSQDNYNHGQWNEPCPPVPLDHWDPQQERAGPDFHDPHHDNHRNTAHGEGPPHPGGDYNAPEETAMTLDAAKRRSLPPWIREGLEKMESTKQKEAKKASQEKELLEKRKTEGGVNNGATDKQTDPSGNIFPGRSRFDSDDEEGTGAQSDENDIKPSERTPDRHLSAEESDKESLTEEEKQITMMIKVKTWVTEILMEVTQNEMEVIAKEVYYREKSKASRAPARQLVKSNALTTITSLGLEYGSESEDSDQSEPENNKDRYTSHGSDSDDDAVYEKIKRKKYEFECKMKELEEEQKEEEERHKREEDRLKRENDILEKSASKEEPKYNFSSQNERIPGLEVKSETAFEGKKEGNVVKKHKTSGTLDSKKESKSQNREAAPSSESSSESESSSSSTDSSSSYSSDSEDSDSKHDRKVSRSSHSSGKRSGHRKRGSEGYKHRDHGRHRRHEESDDEDKSSRYKHKEHGRHRRHDDSDQDERRDRKYRSRSRSRSRSRHRQKGKSKDHSQVSSERGRSERKYASKYRSRSSSRDGHRSKNNKGKRKYSDRYRSRSRERESKGKKYREDSEGERSTRESRKASNHGNHGGNHGNSELNTKSGLESKPKKAKISTSPSLVGKSVPLGGKDKHKRHVQVHEERKRSVDVTSSSTEERPSERKVSVHKKSSPKHKSRTRSSSQ